MNAYRRSFRGLGFVVIWSVAVIALVLSIHFTNDVLFDLLSRLSFVPDPIRALVNSKQDNIVTHILVPVKLLLFALSLVIVVLPLVGDLLNTPHARGSRSKRTPPFKSVLVFLILACLVLPVGVRDMGAQYALLSVSPFEASQGWYHNRLLMPAVAHFLLFRGFFFFFGLSLLFTMSLVYLTNLWLQKNEVRLSTWQVVSLCTSSFVVFQFQVPGYPDVIVHLLLLATVTFRLTDFSKVALLVLALLAHESSIFISGILCLFILRPRYWLSFYVIVLLYYAVWLGSYGFDVPAALQSHHVAGQSGFAWFASNTATAVIGIGFAYKLLWACIGTAIVASIYQRRWKPGLLMVLLILASLSMAFLAVDTSRMVGWSFIALLFAVRELSEGARSRKLLVAALAANLLIPSAYVTLNAGVVLRPGLYGWFASSLLATP